MRFLSRPLLALALMPLIPWLQARVDARLGVWRAQEEVLYLWSGKHVRRLAPGFEDLMADVYWLRTVQYYGGQRVFAREKRFDLLEPLSEITTALDPRFEIAYRYGAIFLSEPWPVGAGNPRAGIALLERGAASLPRSWRLRQELGFFLFFFLGDARRAADVLLQARREIPDAPWWLETLAADFLARGGERATSRQLWWRMYESSEPGPIRSNALRQLQYLDALDALDALRARLTAFRERTGRWPATLAELDPRGVGPLDPVGIPYAYERDAGRVSLSRRSPLWRPGVP